MITNFNCDFNIKNLTKSYSGPKQCLLKVHCMLNSACQAVYLCIEKVHHIWTAWPTEFVLAWYYQQMFWLVGQASHWWSDQPRLAWRTTQNILTCEPSQSMVEWPAYIDWLGPQPKTSDDYYQTDTNSAITQPFLIGFEIFFSQNWSEFNFPKLLAKKLSSIDWN